MTYRRFKFTIALILASFIIQASSQQVYAMFIKLTDEQEEKAIEYGKSTAYDEDYDKEWRIINDLREEAIIYTSFLRIAIAARNATLQETELTKRQIDSILRRLENRVQFQVTLRGDSEEFARRYNAVIIEGDKRILPVFKQNERTALMIEGNKFLARNYYSFPMENINPEAEIKLIVIAPDGKEKEFIFDLSKIR